MFGTDNPTKSLIIGTAIILFTLVVCFILFKTIGPSSQLPESVQQQDARYFNAIGGSH